MKEISEKIFKTYDIRGVYKSEINEDVAYKIGKAFVAFLGKENPKIVIGRDGRISSPLLFNALKKGVLDSGGDVVNTGLSTTPLLNFTVAKNNYDGGVMVTASHNPKEFNGFKVIKENALQVYGEDILKIKKIIDDNDFRRGRGREIDKNLLPEYTEHLFSFTNNPQRTKIVVDCGNGVGGVTAVPLFKKLKNNTFFLYEDVDGDFPNHLPNPDDENSKKEVAKKIIEKGADVGVIFDGDADRCVLLNEKGEVVPTDHLLSLISKEELRGGEEVYYDLRFSMTTAEEIKKGGGVPVMMRVGNPFYKEKIIKEGGFMGAELSGHIMFKENFGIDDGLFAFLKVLNILEKENKPLSELINPFKRYFQTEEINMKVENKKEVLKKVEKYFSDGESIKIDGVYIKYEDWWFNLRESNTEDLVRLRVEAKTENLLKEKKEKLISLIKN